MLIDPPCDNSTARQSTPICNITLYIAIGLESIFMGGLALMVISPKKLEFWPIFMSTLWIIQPHLKSFNDFI